MSRDLELANQDDAVKKLLRSVAVGSTILVRDGDTVYTIKVATKPVSSALREIIRNAEPEPDQGF